MTIVPAFSQQTPHKHEIYLQGGALETPETLAVETGYGRHTLTVARSADGVEIEISGSGSVVDDSIYRAALEFLTAGSRDIGSVKLRGNDDSVIDPRCYWQLPEPWMGARAYPHPQIHTVSNGRYHPVRPPKPTGVVYERYIPWLDQRLSFRVADPDQDLEHFHRWMNDEAVNVIWEDGGDWAKHRDILEERARDPHVMALIGAFDGVPFGYFEVYWAKENRLGPFYDAGDYDRGWHVAIGEPAFRGRQWITAWLPSLMHFMFLDDPRTQRIVGEPRATHEQQIRNLERSGFAKVKHFDFPHKRALLVMLTRERFFDDRLWVPAA